MPKYEGCVEAKEISLTRKGANQFAKVLIRKTAVDPAAPGNQVETSEMPTQAEITKAALAMTVAVAKMDDVTKSHFLALGDEAQATFIVKTAAEQKTEAHAAKALADRQAIEAEAAKTGRTATEVAMQKRLDDQAAEIETLKAARVEGDLEKRAATEFDGYPGGAAVVVPLLKAYATLPEAIRVASEEVLKAQAKSAKESTKALGGRTEEEVSKATTSHQRIMAKAEEVAKSKNIPVADAFIQVTEMAEFAADAANLV